MGKLIMWNVITLDGYFEGEQKWELPFHMTVWGPELEKFSLEQLSTASHLVFGRTTYEGMAAHWTKTEGEIADYMNALPKIVCSRTLKSADWNNSILLSDDVGQKIAKLKAESDKDMYVFGSANLSETFIREDIFDEYRICIAPLLFGKGHRLFEKTSPERNLTLEKSTSLSNGGVVLTYSAKKP